MPGELHAIFKHLHLHNCSNMQSKTNKLMHGVKNFPRNFLFFSIKYETFVYGTLLIFFKSYFYVYCCFFLSKMQIPHSTSVVEWVCLFLKAYKRVTPLLLYTHISPPLKVICSIAQLFWVFIFCLNFLGN